MRGDGSTHKAVANCSLFSSETLIRCPLFCSVWGCRIRICISLNLKQKYSVLGFLFVCFCTPPRNSPPSATSLSFSALWQGLVGALPFVSDSGKVGYLLWATVLERLISEFSSLLLLSCYSLLTQESPGKHEGSQRWLFFLCNGSSVNIFNFILDFYDGGEQSNWLACWFYQ